MSYRNRAGARDAPGLIVPTSTEEAKRLIRDASKHAASSLPEFASLEQAQLDGDMHRLLTHNAAPSFSRSGYSDIQSFFAEANKDYDTDLQSPYWSFTHEILKFILTTHIVAHFSEVSRIRCFDAGAGTGNWSSFVLSLNTGISGILFDMNPDMLKWAHAKMKRLHGNSVRIVEGNLEVPSDYPHDRSNLVLCMHNVIGLGRNSERILRNLFQYLDNGGLAFLMAMNKYHAFNFTRHYCGQLEALRVVTDGTVKFKGDMPEMFCYTPEELKRLLERCGFEDVRVLGYPITVYPTPEDTQLLRAKTFDARLNDKTERERMLAVEKRLCLNPWLAYRGGGSLIAVAKKK